MPHSDPFHSLRARASHSFGVNLSAVPITVNGAATGAVGRLAFATRRGVTLHPAALGQGALTDEIVLHELAHMAQFCAPRSGARLSPADLEREADDAAEAARHGVRHPVLRREGMPAALPFWPLILLAMASGVGLTVYGSTQPRDTPVRDTGGKKIKDLTPEEQARVVKQHVEPHIHESWWGLVPFVGSVDQMLNGRNIYTKLGGGVFFLLDCTLIGGILSKTTAKGGTTVATKTLVQGGGDDVAAALVRPGPVAQEGLKRVIAGKGTQQQAEAFQEVIKAIAREDLKIAGNAVTKTTVDGMTKGGTYIMAGNRGWLNHSVVYVFHNGKRYLVHGGPTKRIYQYAGETINYSRMVNNSGRFMKNWNTVSIYSGKHLSGLSDDALREMIEAWSVKRGGIRSAMSFLDAPGCSFTQGHVLQSLKVAETSFGNRMFPIFMKKSLHSGHGVHFVLNNTRRYTGTLLQTGTVGTMFAGTHYSATSLSAATHQRDQKLEKAAILKMQVERMNLERRLRNQKEAFLERDETIGFKSIIEGKNKKPEEEVLWLEEVDDMELGEDGKNPKPIRITAPAANDDDK
ncbi:MAG: DUF4157 domain-containing protein [Pseudomonadota bacterium]